MTGHNTRPTELACETTIIAAARLGGWRVHGERSAQRQSGRWSTPIKGHAGWPDLFLVRGTRLLAVELKRKPNKVEAAQVAWLAALTAAGVDARVVWVPEEMTALCQELVAR